MQASPTEGPELTQNRETSRQLNVCVRPQNWCRATSPDVLYAPHQAVPLRPVCPASRRRPVTISPDRHLSPRHPASPGPPPLKRETSHEEMLAHDEMVRQTREEAHSLFDLSAGPLSSGSCISTMDVLNPDACEMIINDIRLPDGTLPDFDGVWTHPHPSWRAHPRSIRARRSLTYGHVTRLRKWKGLSLATVAANIPLSA